MMFLPGIPVGLAFSMINNAEGAMMQFLSIFPLTSYAAMPLRMANTSVPMWQWLLSVSLLVLCMWWLKTAATRIFELGIRMYGKEPDWSLLLSTFLFPTKQKS
jgi:ABC-2 type transport system permease protein